MKHSYTTHKRKLRQLKSLSKRIKQMQSGVSVSAELENLISRVKRLVNELRNVFAVWQLKKVLGAAALFAGITFTNTAKAQNFAAVQQNTFGLAAVNYNSSPAFVDLDNDGDLDLMVGGYYGDWNYFQNTGTAAAPAFSPAQSNPFGLTATYYFATPSFVDLDNDGDKDMISTELYGNFQYFMNTGTASAPAFGSPTQNPFGLAPVTIFGMPSFGDLDNDGDKDLMVGETGGNIKYFQNTGSVTAPAFGTAQTNPFGLTSLGTATNSVAAPTFIDMDGDGDLDVMATDANGDFYYFANTGTASAPAFAAPVMNPFSLAAVNGYAMMSFADIDNDGDKDLMCGDYDGNLNYFERLNATGIKSQELSEATSLHVFPNPAVESFTISGPWSEFITSVEIIDVTGKVCAQHNGNSKQISVKELAQGVYTVKITHENGSYEVKKLQKN
ncbi:MAG: T9SS type A sorting domain-containing protein [Bacteroidia bacterium]|nr:T9SS type A sorting domain-containing protein [Bacteroidia bacterium]